MLGCSQDTLCSVKSKVEEQTKTEHKVPGERKLHVLKMKLTKAKSHLTHLEDIFARREEEYCHAKDEVVKQEKYLGDIPSQHDIAFQRVVEGSVIGSAKSDGPGIEDLSDEGD